VDPLEWILAFVDEISAPARAMSGSVRELTKSLQGLQEITNKLKPVTLPGLGSAGSASSRANNEMKRFADMWQKIGLRMQKDQAAALKATEPGVSKSFADMWQRIGARMMADQTKAMRQAAKTAAAEAEKSAHKSYFGGHKSISGLLGARAEHKMSGLATGAADALLGAPATLVTGALSAVGSLVEGTTAMAFNFGKAAISAQAMREESVEAFKAIYGNEDTANRLFDQARKMAKDTKFDTVDVVKMYNTLAANNFGVSELDKWSRAVADIESARKGKGETFLNAISRIRGSQLASFGQVQSAGLQGPGIENVFRELAKVKGMDTNTDRFKWMKLFRKGGVTREEALQAVEQAVAGKYDTRTGKVGEFAAAQGSKTWSGVLSNIKNGLGDVLNMRFSENHPINKFKEILMAIGSPGGLFDESSESGRRFSKLMSNLVEDVFSIFGGLADKTDDSIKSILSLGEALERQFKKVTDYIRDKITPAIVEAINSPNLDQHLTAFAAKIITIISKGILAALDAALPEWVTGPKNLPPLPSGVVTPWNINNVTPSSAGTSPAAGGGVELGGGITSHAGGGKIPGPFGRPRMIIGHGTEEILPLGTSLASMRGGDGAGMSVTAPVHIYGNLSMDESDISRAVEQGIQRGGMLLLEKLAVAQGAQRA